MTGPAYLVSKNGKGVTHPGESKTEREIAALPNLVTVAVSGCKKPKKPKRRRKQPMKKRPHVRRFGR
jgi:hypothetical protein